MLQLEFDQICMHQYYGRLYVFGRIKGTDEEEVLGEFTLAELNVAKQFAEQESVKHSCQLGCVIGEK